MIGFVLRRLAQLVPVVVMAALAVWALVYALPGDPAAVLGGVNASDQEIEAIRQRLGLDRPVWEQFATWLGHVVRGDMGTSITSGHSVTSLLATAIPATVQLAVLAMIVVVLVAVPLGTVVALAPRSWPGRLVKGYLSLSLATPPFWLGLLLILLFSVRWKLMPASSRYVAFFDDPAGALQNSLLPALALGVYSGGVLARFVASSLAEAMQSDYVRTARSKGASEVRVVVRHAARNSMLPSLTVGALQLGSLIGGAVVMEVLFNYPGVGKLMFTSVNGRDYASLQGSIMFITVVFLLLSLVVDLLYAVLDPRIRLR
ncbi:ABC transporter permease [Streptomyces tagetis]|uniref:ABC transporter permease n=1 Tax=Streptomyces tagetis TaxID=2820809 RepID=A0A940XF89_9ACTN|nr:ABC transporter permease [Streptomyces sp. RG38]MBQ0827221.1 ABC transporter permease [Streptomyces sp. RG38]